MPSSCLCVFVAIFIRSEICAERRSRPASGLCFVSIHQCLSVSIFTRRSCGGRGECPSEICAQRRCCLLPSWSSCPPYVYRRIAPKTGNAAGIFPCLILKHLGHKGTRAQRTAVSGPSALSADIASRGARRAKGAAVRRAPRTRRATAPAVARVPPLL